MVAIHRRYHGALTARVVFRLGAVVASLGLVARALPVRHPVFRRACVPDATLASWIGLKRAPRMDPSATKANARSLGDVLGFMQLLWAVTHGLESTSKRMRASVGVTGPQRLVVRLIGHYGDTSPGDLADVLHVHPSSLTGVLRRLERAGLIRRRRDPLDGRRAILTLTRRGQRLNDRRSGTVESSVRRTLGQFSAAKTEAAREILHALARELGVGKAPL